MIWMKICGITRATDAEAAAAAGASGVGFVFWNRSPRCVSASQALEAASALPPGVERAGVFVDACRDEILRVFEKAQLDWVQLAGSEEIEFARGLGVPWVKVFRAGEGAPAPAAEQIAPFAAEAHERRFLLDTRAGAMPGGTGRSFDWGLAEPLARTPPAGGRLVLAGGLAAGNVGAAVARLRPSGVDVSSGVEAAPGIKDPSRIRAFAAAVKEAGEAIERGAAAP